MDDDDLYLYGDGIVNVSAPLIIENTTMPIEQFQEVQDETDKEIVEENDVISDSDISTDSV